MSAGRKPELECDVVMKGGITSGVVYPGAVLALKDRYRFRSIGGASAGGIAAAMVAAAEHAREQGGFDELAKLPDELASKTPGGDPFMLQLFQADAATRPLFSVLIACLRRGPVGALKLRKAFPRFPRLAAVVAVVPIVLLFFGADPAFAVAGVFVATVILALGLGRDVFNAAMRLPDNDFGLCRLGPAVGTDQAPALTVWLHRRIQQTAGRSSGDPLTVGDLWAGKEVLPPPEQREERLKRLVELSRHPSKRAVDLQMMTTDLTHGRPLRLPVPFQPHEEILEEQAGGLLFDPVELDRFFPRCVVAYLERCARPTSEKTAKHLRRVGAPQLKHFPIGPDLPVVVATRMTLSFPVLIAAVPLYELDFRLKNPPLVRVLFSDGGITSNFPVHFFDSPLPTRPTFGLNLTGFGPGETPDRENPCEAVRAPQEPNRPVPLPVAHIADLGGFFTAIKDAMQNWRDNAQAQLPGYRDRVVDLKLAAGEGGLNLTMDECKIRELNARGACAGEALVELFAGDGSEKPKQWNDHRFVRYRTTMSLLERFLGNYAKGYETDPDPATIPYAERIKLGADKPYEFPKDGVATAQATTKKYLDLVAERRASHETLDDANVPRPPSTLRAVPPV